MIFFGEFVSFRTLEIVRGNSYGVALFSYESNTDKKTQ